MENNILRKKKEIMKVRLSICNLLYIMITQFSILGMTLFTMQNATAVGTAKPTC